MSLYYIPSESRLVDLNDATYDMWVATGNPKADYYKRIPDPPHPAANWDGQAWQMPDLDEVKAAKRLAIKTAARQTILNRYPEWRQANLTARAVELVSLNETSGPEWQQMQAIWGWIKAVRAHSDLLEADVANCTTVEAVEGIVIGGWPD